MAHCITVSEDVEYRDVFVRLLEIRADTLVERDALRTAARRKGWSDWVVGDAPLSDGRWGAVMEKGMPEQPDVSGLLAMAELEESGVALSWGAAMREGDAHSLHETPSFDDEAGSPVLLDDAPRVQRA